MRWKRASLLLFHNGGRVPLDAPARCMFTIFVTLQKVDDVVDAEGADGSGDEGERRQLSYWSKATRPTHCDEVLA